jgi:hypothetical protein
MNATLQLAAMRIDDERRAQALPRRVSITREAEVHRAGTHRDVAPGFVERIDLVRALVALDGDRVRDALMPASDVDEDSLSSCGATWRTRLESHGAAGARSDDAIEASWRLRWMHGLERPGTLPVAWFYGLLDRCCIASLVEAGTYGGGSGHDAEIGQRAHALAGWGGLECICAAKLEPASARVAFDDESLVAHWLAERPRFEDAWGVQPSLAEILARLGAADDAARASRDWIALEQTPDAAAARHWNALVRAADRKGADGVRACPAFNWTFRGPQSPRRAFAQRFVPSVAHLVALAALARTLP